MPAPGSPGADLGFPEPFRASLDHTVWELSHVVPGSPGTDFGFLEPFWAMVSHPARSLSKCQTASLWPSPSRMVMTLLSAMRPCTGNCQELFCERGLRSPSPPPCLGIAITHSDDSGACTFVPLSPLHILKVSAPHVGTRSSPTPSYEYRSST